MSFIKHGDGKIVNVLDETDLTDQRKKSVKKMSEQIVKRSDTSKTEKSGS